MKDAAPQVIRLADYAPPAWLVDEVSLIFRLDPAATRVQSRISFRANPAAPGHHDLWLDGENLKLLSARINGEARSVTPGPEGLRIPATELPEGQFLWEAEVEIAPEGNTALEGLYMSRGMYCTQCEAEGFRKITFYPDRPDVMATFRVRIESELPVLLSNGNPTAQGAGWAEWHDPWPKPAYLFALVAGDLVAQSNRFTTVSGTEVALNIWVRPGDENKCAYAMDALIRSMRWDEEVYGREYDLDVFNIVAVDDFNMGAMENKGLNIFNSRYVLASPETATDQDYENIERIIAHEYFHNWTGNRITCRDWFQLCLKEGLTVYRDQQFTGDMRSHAVKRIEDVLTLRARQFREDNGPLAHNVRPETYVEINNFYTATVYEKGAELIGMLRRLVGDDAYRAALRLYFERHDGQACTIEDWIRVFEDTTHRDLSQFKRWYSQAGTPRVMVEDSWADGTYVLRLHQSVPATPGQPLKEPLVIPVAVGLLGQDGRELQPTVVLELSEPVQEFRFEGLPQRPVPSILRGFSAPVILQRDQTSAERAVLLAHDTDPFNRWEAGRSLARDVLLAMIARDEAPSTAFLEGLGSLLRDPALDPAFIALALRLPSEDDLAQALHEAGEVPDPARIHDMRRKLTHLRAEHLAEDLHRIHDAMASTGAYDPAADQAGRRALRNAALAGLTHLDQGARASRQFATADNMTEQLGALSALLEIGAGADELAAFYDQWRGDRLVLDKWFGLQVMFAAPDAAAETAAGLAAHPDFDWKNPNRFRAVIGGLSANAAGFHHASGAGYRFVADWLIRLDPLNPQTAARMSTAFETWQRYDPGRQALIRAELERMRSAPTLSRDLGEMVGRMLG
ncbi:aminopeptidase N [Plastorhodobacter daqingensis]|uniref:Aminopeptidase N n=1 Tax=Plastorhodobacter daqingensis TaxID=1387281 RepID=A0ABW2UHD3_9RHOB